MLSFRDWCIYPASFIPLISYSVHCRTWIRELAGDNLDHQHSCLEAVQLLGVNGRVQQSLRRHIGWGSWAFSEGSEVRVQQCQFAHPKISHLCPDTCSDQQNIVAGEISMHNLIGVEKGQGLSRAVAIFISIMLHSMSVSQS